MIIEPAVKGCLCHWHLLSAYKLHQDKEYMNDCQASSTLPDTTLLPTLEVSVILYSFQSFNVWLLIFHRSINTNFRQARLIKNFIWHHFCNPWQNESVPLEDTTSPPTKPHNLQSHNQQSHDTRTGAFEQRLRAFYRHVLVVHVTPRTGSLMSIPILQPEKLRLSVTCWNR